MSRLLCLTILFLSIAESGLSADPASTGSVVYLKQGWTPQRREWFYNTTQGSRLVPADWFLALEVPTDASLFSSPQNMGSFGFVASRSKAENPDSLPVGFVRDVAAVSEIYILKREMLKRGLTKAEHSKTLESLVNLQKSAKIDEPAGNYFQMAISNAINLSENKVSELDIFPKTQVWIGLTCAACHTSEIKHEEHVIRVDGAPSMSDVEKFLSKLLEALYATIQDDSKFERFAKRVLTKPTQEQAAQLRREVDSYTSALAGLQSRSHSPVEYGYGRLDAFGILINEIIGTAMGIPDNYRIPDAPVSYPFLWDTPDLDWVQWNGFAHNPLARNVGEVLGVFADLRLQKLDAVDTSANLTNLHHLEESVKQLAPPKWPEAIFGSLDKKLVLDGQGVYDTHCSKCHVREPYSLTVPNLFGRKLLKVDMVPLTDIKTDPRMAMNFLKRKAKPGIFAADFGGAVEVPAPKLLGAAVKKVLATEFDKLKLTPAQRLAFVDRREELGPTEVHLASYKARSLSGIWATAPYLHNGSVPSLVDLLKPANKRPKTFSVGSRVFDPKKVGFKDEGEFLFDTKYAGNLNSGHEYATDLAENDQLALIEFLKSL